MGETTRPFRYDLNQIPYDYTVEVRNRFKGLDLIDSAWWTMGYPFIATTPVLGCGVSPLGCALFQHHATVIISSGLRKITLYVSKMKECKKKKKKGRNLSFSPSWRPQTPFFSSRAPDSLSTYLRINSPKVIVTLSINNSMAVGKHCGGSTETARTVVVFSAYFKSSI